MLSRRRAERLVRRAGRRRADGRRSRLTQRAWRLLDEAGSRGQQNAIEAVWRMWLAHPDEESWARLAGWRPADDVGAAVFAAAVDPGRPAAERSAIGAFCARHMLAPPDPVQHAAFCILTGQLAQHRALDPDGTLLPVVYAAADAATRQAMRQELAQADGLDLIRVLSRAGVAQVAQLTRAELDHVCGQLAGRRDWPALWHLARELPLVPAVRATRLIDSAWQPAGDRDRGLFGRLAGASTRELASARDALTARSQLRIMLDGGDAVVRVPRAASFSPDGQELAVLVTLPYHGAEAVYVYSLPDGRLARRHEGALVQPYAGSSLVHANDEVMISTGPRYECKRWAHGVATAMSPSTNWISVAPRQPGFVGLVASGPLRPGQPTEHWLWFCDADGRVERSVSLTADLGLPSETFSRFYGVVTELTTGRLAVYCAAGLWLVDPAGTRVLAAHAPSEGFIDAVCFPGEDLITVFCHGGWISTLRFADGRLEPIATGQVKVSFPGASFGSRMIAVAQRGEIVIVDPNLARAGGGPVTYLDARTLRKVDGRREFTGKAGVLLASSREGRHALGSHFVHADGVMHVVLDARAAVIAGTANRPPSSYVPGDLAAVTALRGDRRPGSAEWPLLDLLHASLEYRFGEDVGIGTTRPAGDAEDIALAEGGQR